MRKRILSVIFIMLMVFNLLSTDASAQTSESEYNSPIFKVVLPTSVNFIVDPYQNIDKRSMIASPEFSIINKSSVPVKINLSFKITSKDGVVLDIKDSKSSVSGDSNDHDIWIAAVFSSDIKNIVTQDRTLMTPSGYIVYQFSNGIGTKTDSTALNDGISNENINAVSGSATVIKNTDIVGTETVEPVNTVSGSATEVSGIETVVSTVSGSATEVSGSEAVVSGSATGVQYVDISETPTEVQNTDIVGTETTEPVSVVSEPATGVIGSEAVVSGSATEVIGSEAVVSGSATEVQYVDLSETPPEVQNTDIVGTETVEPVSVVSGSEAVVSGSATEVSVEAVVSGSATEVSGSETVVSGPATEVIGSEAVVSGPATEVQYVDLSETPPEVQNSDIVGTETVEPVSVVSGPATGVSGLEAEVSEPATEVSGSEAVVSGSATGVQNVDISETPAEAQNTDIAGAETVEPVSAVSGSAVTTQDNNSNSLQTDNTVQVIEEEGIPIIFHDAVRVIGSFGEIDQLDEKSPEVLVISSEGNNCSVILDKAKTFQLMDNTIVTGDVADNGDGVTSFRFIGYVNPNADWSDTGIRITIDYTFEVYGESDDDQAGNRTIINKVIEDVTAASSDLGFEEVKSEFNILDTQEAFAEDQTIDVEEHKLE